jgi:hypothetical protein
MCYLTFRGTEFLILKCALPYYQIELKMNGGT